MKKILAFLIISLFIYQGGIVLAIDKNYSAYKPTSDTNTITKSGSITGISIEDKWLTFNGTTRISKLKSTIVNMLKIQVKTEVITYRVNILDNTKMETNDGKAITLEELQINDYAKVTGRLISETANKIDDYKTEKIFLIEASYIKINNRRGMIESITTSFINYFQRGGAISANNRSSIITNPDGTIELKPYDNTAERQGKCVGYGKPIVENRESAPTQPQSCCEGLREYEALAIKFEDKPTVNIQGYIYTVKAYCYGSDGIPSDIIGKVFEKDDCISEGEPLLIGGILAPKVLDKCCEGLVECVADSYKSYPQPTGTEVIGINGFSYIVKGYCRKECPKKSNINTDLLLPRFEPSVSSLGKCYRDSDCCTASNPLCNQICIEGKCVYRDPSDVGFLSGCNQDKDCFYDGEGCVLKAGGYEFNMLNWILMNDPRGCACNTTTHKCVLVDNKNSPTLDGCNVNTSCPEDNTPVCGKDGKTYANPCETIRCNTVVACAGKCPCRTTPSVPSLPIMPSPNPGKCEFEDDCELCGAECFEQTMLSQLKMTGKTCTDTFDNLKCICQDGNCLAMPDVYNPDQPCDDAVELVCGTDGKTYQNKCEASKSSTSVKCSGACPCEAHPPTILCPALYQPVCGTNNKTYKNICFAQQAGAMIKCNQACPCPTGSITPPDNNLNPDVSPGTNPVLPVSLKETNINGFCGLQTETTCGNDLDCRVAGCSGEICQAKSDGSMNTTCGFKDCYLKPSNVYCGCDAGKCKWYGTLNTQLNNVYTPVINNPGTITIDQNGGIVAPSIGY